MHRVYSLQQWEPYIGKLALAGVLVTLVYQKWCQYLRLEVASLLHKPARGPGRGISVASFASALTDQQAGYVEQQMRRQRSDELARLAESGHIYHRIAFDELSNYDGILEFREFEDHRAPHRALESRRRKRLHTPARPRVPSLQ